MQLAQLASCPWHATLSPPPSKSNLAEARSSYLTECLPFETKRRPHGRPSNNIVLSHRRKSARVRQAPGIAPPRGQAASAPRRAPNKGQGRVPVGAAASAGPAVPSGRPERRKAPPASGTTCPPAAWRRSTFGEVGLNCRVRNGIGCTLSSMNTKTNLYVILIDRGLGRGKFLKNKPLGLLVLVS